MRIIRKGPFKNQRGMFDFFRGYTIISIVFLHIVLSWNIQLYPFSASTILSRNTPLLFGLFIISGYGFCASEPLDCLKKQAKLLLLPYGCMLAACLLIQTIKNIRAGDPFWRDLAGYIFSFVFATSGDSSLYPFSTVWVWTRWIPVALFVAWNVLNAIFLIKDERLQSATALLIGVLGVMTTNFKPWIWCIPQGLQAAFLLYIGWNLKRTNFFSRKMPVPLLISLLIPACISLFFGKVDMPENIYRLDFLDYLGSAAGAVLLLKLYSCLDLSGVPLAEEISAIGRYTYWIICIHAVDMLAVKFRDFLVALPGPSDSLKCFVNCLLSSCLIFVCCACIEWLERFYFKFKQKKKREKNV